MARRRFVQGLAAGGVVASMPGLARAALENRAHTGTAPVLTGTEIQLVVEETLVNYTGKPRMATTINGSIPAPTLRLREGDTVTLRVTNRLKESTSIHWHGIILPFQMDGVPGISFKGIPPGETFTYRFKLQQSGTYWYHSHSGMQELTGMYGALIVEPKDGERIRADREHVVLLSDWTDEEPGRVFAKLKAQGDYYNFHQPTVMDFFNDAAHQGLRRAMAKREMWNDMRMSPTDLADLSAETLTYLMNGSAPAANWTGLFKPGERVRLRFINGAGNTFYDVRIPGLKMTVVQSDGLPVEPVTVDEFRFGPGETYDVIVEPRDMPYTLFAQAMDRSGYARGTLAPREGLSAPVPAIDPVQPLTMGDMMGDMSSMDHGAMRLRRWITAPWITARWTTAPTVWPWAASPNPASRCATPAPNTVPRWTCGSTPRGRTWTIRAWVCAATAARCSPSTSSPPSAARWTIGARAARSSCT